MAAGREWKVQDGEQNSNFNKTHKSEHDLSPQLTSSKVRIPSLTFNFRILICSINCEHSFFFSSSLSLKFFSQTSNHPQDYPFIFPTINNNLKEPHMFQPKIIEPKRFEISRLTRISNTKKKWSDKFVFKAHILSPSTIPLTIRNHDPIKSTHSKNHIKNP